MISSLFSSLDIVSLPVLVEYRPLFDNEIAEASRGDQIMNADYVVKKGYAKKLEQKDISTKTLIDGVNSLYANRKQLAERMKADPLLDGTEEVLDEIFKAAGVKA